MPNWCANTLTLEHDDPAMLDRAFQALERREFLSEFVPIPQALRETTSGHHADGDTQEKLELLQEINQSIYHYKDWYDFCVNEWGTKWDVGQEGANELCDGQLHANFDSAWAPPIAAYNRLVDLGFRVHATYYEPGCAFAGVYDNGDDDYYELDGLSADQVADTLPEELEDIYAIAENMREYEEDQDEQEEDEQASEPYRPYNDAKDRPAERGEYEVLIDAPWPMGGPSRGQWTGRGWKNLAGQKIQITGWREISTGDL